MEEMHRSLEQTIVKIGDVAFVTFPYELFSEIGMRIDQAVPTMQILSLSNANGAMGYFPTQDQLCRGGYEIGCFKYNKVQPYTDDADYKLICETLRHIRAFEETKK